MSVGGVLGGLWFSVVVTMGLNSVLEFPLELPGARLLLPRLGLRAENPWYRLVDMVVPACLCAFGLATAFIFTSRDSDGCRFLNTIAARLPEAARAKVQQHIGRFAGQDVGVLDTESRVV